MQEEVVVENNALAVIAAETAANTAAAMAGAAGNKGKGSTGKGDDWDAGGDCEGTREQCAVRDGTRGPGHTELPIADKDPTGGKLENPAPAENTITTLTTPDQSDKTGASHTGNSDGAPSTAGNTTTTPIPDGPNKDNLAYLSSGNINAGKFGQLELDSLSKTGTSIDPAAKSGNFTVAGRALQKHGSRDGSAYPSAKGTPAQINEQGQKILDGIINAPNASVKEGNRFGGFDVIAPDGRGARFDPQGNFRGFLEP